MRKLAPLLLLLFAILSIGVPQLLAQDAVAARTVLQVVETDPLGGQEAGLTDAITLFFDRDLNCDSAERAFNISPGIAGALDCDGSRLIFTPDVPYERATAYTIILADSIESENGVTLLEDYQFSFMTTGYLSVTETFPANGAFDVTADSAITVIFNRPIVPLTVSGSDIDLPNPLTFDPPVTGTGEWLNTAIYVFEPDSGLAGGTTYTAIVNPPLDAIDDSILQDAYRWSFSTQAPQITQTFPAAQANGVALNEMLQVTFNQPMNRASVEANFYLRIEGVTTTGTVPGTFEWNDDDTGFGYTLAENLSLNGFYVAGFDDGVQAAAGSATLDGMTSWNFATANSPAIVGSEPTDGQTDAPLFGGLWLYFASRMDVDTLADKITILPEPTREPTYIYQESSEAYFVQFPVEAGTDYAVAVAPGMADIYGNTIDTTFTLNYRTADLQLDIQLQVPGSVGVYNAYRNPTELFLTHVNVSQVDLQLYGVSVEDFARRLSGESYYNPTQNYLPQPASLVRQWQIESVAPLNTGRYERLVPADVPAGNVSPVAPAEEVECPGALPTRLQIGDIAVVDSEPDPVRVRTEPGGDIVDLLYKDYQLPVIAGPACPDGNLRWWQVRLRDGNNVWIAESVGEEYLLNISVPAAPPPVVPVQQVIDPDTGNLTPGIYYLQASSPETQNLGYDPEQHFMVLATANLTVKTTVDSMTVWATDLQSGLPIANAPIAAYDDQYNQIATGTTDADGIAQIAIPRISDLYVRQTVVLDDGMNFGLGFTEWTEGIDPWQFNQQYDFYPREYALYVYTDRPIYRPGQPVYFRGIVRGKNDLNYTLPDLETVPVQIFDNQGNIVFEENLEISDYGGFSAQLDLSDDAGVGYYYIQIDLPSQGLYNSEGGGVGFNVAEFRLPEFIVEVTADDDEVVQGDTIDVTVENRFFFGGAVSGAEVEYYVSGEPYRFDYQGDGFYNFYDFSDDGEFFGRGFGQILNDEAMTDADGMLTFSVPADLEDATESRQYLIEAIVRDESNQTVSGRTRVVVHPGDVFIGARPQRYISTANEESIIEIISVDVDSQPVPNQEIAIEVVERRWSNVQEQDETGRTTFMWEVEEIPLEDSSGTITTDENGDALYSFTPPAGGVYKVRLTTRDSQGNQVQSATTIWVSGSNYVAWRQDNDNRLDLIADKDDYNIGDTAEILITSPFQGTAEALITVERGSVLDIQRVTLANNSFVYELPITEDFAPNVFVTVTLIKGVDENNPVAAFRYGQVQLSVDASRKVMDIDITTDVATAAPQQTVTYTIETTDYQGQPVQAEVGVSLTDLAALSIAPPNVGDMLPFFYGEQGLSVRSATGLTINTDQLTQETLDTIKGGGGGGGGGFGVVEVREEFEDTPYWNAAVITDENGTASFEVTLPDNLTTWRLDAKAVTRGIDGNMLVGEAEFDLLSTKPVLIRPVTPRFFVVGDEVYLAAVVNNNSDDDLDVAIRIDNTNGLTYIGDASGEWREQRISIAAGERGRVTWQVRVDDVSAVQPTFVVLSSDEQYSDGSISPVSLDSDGTLPVYRYEVPETAGTGGVLRSADERVESIVLPQRFAVEDATLTVKLDQSLAAPSLAALDYLNDYPHQSIEQVVSRFLPNIMTFRALNELQLTDDTLASSLNLAVSAGLQKLFAEQKPDGGWGWFVQDESNTLTTAYALIGLIEARDQGFAVNELVIVDAQGFLLANMTNGGGAVPTWQLNRRVFMNYALARSGAVDVSRLARLFDSRDELSLYAKAFLAEALYISNGNFADSRVNALVNDLVNAASLSATGAHWQETQRDFWNWNSNIRTTAIVLGTLTRIMPESDILPNVVRYLMAQRTADAWETTQETAWSVMALTDWMRASGELNPTYSYSLNLNDREQLAGFASPATLLETETLVVDIADLLRDEANLLTFERGAGNGNLYYSAHLEAYLPVTEVQPLDRGILISREYTAADDDDTAITEARIGDLVQVRLTIVVPEDRHYVIIEDPLPAGAEAINPNLSTEQQIGTRPGLDSNNPLSRGWGWWWFSNIEIRDEKVALYSTYLPAGTYEYVYSIRPGIEGTFNVIPATGQESYFPEVYGRSAGTQFTVLPADE